LHLLGAGSAYDPRRSLQHPSKRAPSVGRLPSTQSNVDEPLAGLAARDCFIAHAATGARFPLPARSSSHSRMAASGVKRSEESDDRGWRYLLLLSHGYPGDLGRVQELL